MCRFVGTVPDILGVVWPSFSPKSGSKSQISGRILKSFRGPFSSAEQAPFLGEGGGEQAEADRRFFAGYAQMWRAKYRPDALEVNSLKPTGPKTTQHI